MFIHWFPGHMTKAIRMMSVEMAIIDSVIYVLDARAPLSCINPAFENIIKAKPRLYVLNKADMVPKVELAKWKSYFEKQGCSVITTNSVSKQDAKKIVENLKLINNDLIERYKNKGVNKTIRAMVIGVPNSGKSTLINSLIPQKKAITGNKPGVTRGKQMVAIDPYIDLMDSPGVLYPDFSDQRKATNLALIGSIKEDILDINELAFEMVKFLTQNYPNELKLRYELDEIDQDFQVNLEKIGRRRGFIVRGGDIDTERTAKALILDFRKQYFGKIMLEKVEDYAN